MTQNYAEVITTRQVTIAEVSGSAVGVPAVNAADGQFVIDNVAVHPHHRGTGLGSALLDLAETGQGERVSTSSTSIPTSR